ncbi:Holliday junction branch migration protein RuvA [bacterium]|nr:MAG: Holliday junction branch migration protein RuvA [bacterium]
MIARLSGRLIIKTIESVVLDAGGVGYEAFIPLSTYYKLPEIGEPVTLTVHTHLKDDAIVLYGFLTEDEKEAFKLLITVTGVGPKLAKNILSGIAPSELLSSIIESNRARLSSIPGIGAKTAERLLLELKDKAREAMLRFSSVPSGVHTQTKDSRQYDVVSALTNLGYKQLQAEDAVKKSKAALGAECDFQELLKESLKNISRR